MAAAARFLGLSARTLRRWKDRPRPPRRGRPPHTKKAKSVAKRKVKRLLKTLGPQTGRKTAKACLPRVPLRLLNLALRALKGRHQKSEDKRRCQHRLHTRVLAKEAVLAQDSTHIGNVRRRRVWAEVQKDLGTLKGRAFGKGRPLNGPTMIQHLRRLKATRRLPLVLLTDNAPPYRCKAVETWLKANKVVHLRSRPRTPTDNAGVERGIGEAKRISGLGKGRHLQGRQVGVKQLAKAFTILNESWPRQSRSGYTAKELAVLMPHWRKTVSRRTFYGAVEREVRCRSKGLKGRALRQATRQAVYRVLERFKLVLRWRGPGIPKRAEPWRRG